MEQDVLGGELDFLTHRLYCFWLQPCSFSLSDFLGFRLSIIDILFNQAM